MHICVSIHHQPQTDRSVTADLRYIYIYMATNQIMPIMQLIGGDGEMDVKSLNSYMKTRMVGEASYAALSILGPQSGGKSTLLNHLFGTKFPEMNAARGRGQTTRGIFLAKCNGKLIMDVEGSDSNEREGHLSLEKKLAAFSFAISRIVLVNMSNSDIGRHVAGCMELLETALEFMTCFLGHHKLTMIIVIRDKDPETPFDKIEEHLFHSIEKIWNNIKKSEYVQDKCLKDCVDVQVYAMSHYRFQKDEFFKEVSVLRTRIDEKLQGQETRRYSASEVATKVIEHWNNITRNKKFDIPTYKESIAYQRCKEIAKEYNDHFEKDMNNTMNGMQSEANENFPLKVEKAIQHYLEQYDKDSINFDNSVTSKIRVEMECGLLKIAEAHFEKGLKHLHGQIIVSFKNHLKANFRSNDNIAPQEIIDDTIRKVLDEYHNICKGMIIRNAQWNIYAADDSLKRELEREVADIKDSVVLKKALAVVRKGVYAASAGAAAFTGAIVTVSAETLADAAAEVGAAPVAGVARVAGAATEARTTRLVHAFEKTTKSIRQDIKFLVNRR